MEQSGAAGTESHQSTIATEHSASPEIRTSAAPSADEHGERGHEPDFAVDLSVGTTTDDDDSAIGDIHRPSTTASLTSSAYEYTDAFGRRWSQHRDGKYWMPNDETEQQRLDLQHAIALKLYGKLHLAPVENPGRVLDIGTGTGIWAVEFATSHPASEVIGTDVSPIQPSYVPPNCRFEIDDLEEGLVFTFPFDYVHLRYMIASVDNFPRLFSRIFANLSPGSYVEIQDYYSSVTSLDGTETPEIAQWKELLVAGVRRMGRDATQGVRYKGWLEEAGFVDIVEQRYALPSGPWAKGHDKKILGLMQMTNILEGIDGMSKRLFVSALGMDAEEVDKLLAVVKRDMQDKRVHLYYPMVDIYARKPL